MPRPLRCQHCESTDVQRRGTRRGLRRLFCNECRTSSSVPVPSDLRPADFDFSPDERQREKIESGDVHLVTCAQNNTPIEKQAWRTVLRMREEMGAQLHVLPMRYQNPTSRLDPQDDDADVWWPKEVEPYLVDGELRLHELCRVLGQVRVQATAKHPLTGLESLSGPASAIVGHGQIAMRTIATPQQALPKQLLTTGSVSVKNYSRTKAGVQGDFHHSTGVVVVERDGERFHMRSCVGDRKGTFCDLDAWYTPRGVKRGHRVPAIVVGDEHVMFADPAVLAGTYGGKTSLVGRLRPRVIVRHDVVDSYSISHWHRRDVVTRYVKQMHGRDDLRTELLGVAEHIDESTPRDTQNVIVASNHHDHILRWMNEADWRQDLTNARIYHELWAAVLDGAYWDPRSGAALKVDPFCAWVLPRLRCKDRTRFLRRDEHLTIEGILVSLHGDRGPSGTRGSLGGLSKMGAKPIIGHSHAPGIEKGCYQVGGPDGLGYMRGSPSAAMACHCIVQPNGKRQLVTLVGGKFTEGGP